MSIISIKNFEIKGTDVDQNSYKSSFPVTENYYLKSDNPIELIRVSLMYKYYDVDTEMYAINAGCVFRSVSKIYGGTSESSITASVSLYNYDGYYYGYAYDGAVEGVNNSISEIVATKILTDYLITYEQSNNIYPHEYNTTYYSSALENSYTYVVRSWVAGTLDADQNITRIDNSVLVEPLVFGEIDAKMSILVNNTSDDEIGFIYTIHCRGEVTNPFIYLDETNEIFKINKRFKLDDIITIDTRRGSKSVTVTYRGKETNLFNYIDNSSKWLQLQSGYTHVTQGATSGSERMISTLTYTNEYEGV